MLCYRRGLQSGRSKKAVRELQEDRPGCVWGGVYGHGHPDESHSCNKTDDARQPAQEGADCERDHCDEGEQRCEYSQLLGQLPRWRTPGRVMGEQKQSTLYFFRSRKNFQLMQS